MEEDWFEGAKLALFLGARLVVIERDETPGIAWPGYLDLPGGGREGGESAEACVRREVQEELGLHLPPEAFAWRRFYAAPVRAWFFAAHGPEAWEDRVVFGDEGRAWHLMAPQAFVAHPKAVPHFAERVAAYLAKR